MVGFGKKILALHFRLIAKLGFEDMELKILFPLKNKFHYFLSSTYRFTSFWDCTDTYIYFFNLKIMEYCIDLLLKDWRCNGKGYVAYRNFIQRPRNWESLQSPSLQGTPGNRLLILYFSSTVI